jgi:hypothetical protein
MVDETDLEAALTSYREQRGHLDQMTADYNSRILNPGTLRIAGGGYTVKGAFHFRWDDMARALKKSDGQATAAGTTPNRPCRNRSAWRTRRWIAILTAPRLIWSAVCCAVVALVTTPIRQPELRALRRAHVDVIGAAGVVEAENSVSASGRPGAVVKSRAKVPRMGDGIHSRR